MMFDSEYSSIQQDIWIERLESFLRGVDNWFSLDESQAEDKKASDRGHAESDFDRVRDLITAYTSTSAICNNAYNS